MAIFIVFILSSVMSIETVERHVSLFEFKNDKLAEYVESCLNMYKKPKDVAFLHIEEDNSQPLIRYRLTCYEHSANEDIYSFFNSRVGLLKTERYDLYITGRDPSNQIVETGSFQTVFCNNEKNDIGTDTIIDDSIHPVFFVNDLISIYSFCSLWGANMNKVCDIADGHISFASRDQNGSWFLSIKTLNKGSGIIKLCDYKDKKNVVLKTGRILSIAEAIGIVSTYGTLFVLIDKTRNIIDCTFAPSYSRYDNPSVSRHSQSIKVNMDYLKSLIPSADIVEDGEDEYYLLYYIISKNDKLIDGIDL